MYLCLFAVFFLLVAQLAPELFVPKTTLEKFEVIPQSGKIGRSAVFGIMWDTVPRFIQKCQMLRRLSKKGFGWVDCELTCWCASRAAIGYPNEIF